MQVARQSNGRICQMWQGAKKFPNVHKWDAELNLTEEFYMKLFSSGIYLQVRSRQTDFTFQFET